MTIIFFSFLGSEVTGGRISAGSTQLRTQDNPPSKAILNRQGSNFAMDYTSIFALTQIKYLQMRRSLLHYLRNQHTLSCVCPAITLHPK